MRQLVFYVEEKCVARLNIDTMEEGAIKKTMDKILSEHYIPYDAVKTVIEG